jgi:hypothetical protein
MWDIGPFMTCTATKINLHILSKEMASFQM